MRWAAKSGNRKTGDELSVSRPIRRLSDKLLDAANLAESQGRSDIAVAVKVVQQALLIQELGQQALRRASDEGAVHPASVEL